MCAGSEASKQRFGSECRENAGGLQYAQLGEPFLEPWKPIWVSDRGVLAVLVSNVPDIRELKGMLL